MSSIEFHALTITPEPHGIRLDQDEDVIFIPYRQVPAAIKAISESLPKVCKAYAEQVLQEQQDTD